MEQYTAYPVISVALVPPGSPEKLYVYIGMCNLGTHAYTYDICAYIIILWLYYFNIIVILLYYHIIDCYIIILYYYYIITTTIIIIWSLL